MSSETAPTPNLKALFLGFSSVGLSGFGGLNVIAAIVSNQLPKFFRNGLIPWQT